MKHCCVEMERQVTHRCRDHSNPQNCPDALVGRFGKVFGLRIHDGGGSFVLIRHCPWCGADINRSKRPEKGAKPLFTVILDYEGGTYISQVHSTSTRTALFAWLKRLPKARIPGIGKRAIASLRSSLAEEQVVTLSRLSQVWCASCSLRRGLALINVVQTDQSAG